MKGMICKPENIKAFVEGRKSVTRRMDGLKEINRHSEWYLLSTVYLTTGTVYTFGGLSCNDPYIHVKPRYHPGEIIYVKEAWAAMAIFDHLKPSELDARTPIGFGDTDWDLLTGCGYDKGKSRSPLFLPERFARYHLKILSVSPERLGEITDDEIDKEGIGNRISFIGPWNRINPQSPFNTNTWVWRNEFEVIRELHT